MGAEHIVAMVIIINIIIVIITITIILFWASYPRKFSEMHFVLSCVVHFAILLVAQAPCI